MAKRGHIIIGLDIGNTAIKAAAIEIGGNLEKPQVVGVGIAPTSGLRRGEVVDKEEITKGIGDALNQIRQSAGVPTKRVYVNISGPSVRTQVSRGVIAVSRADNQISESDVQRVIEAASAISLPLNREILHIIPRNYVIDGQESTKDPIGMSGVRLEAEVLIIDGLAPTIHNLAKCILANDVEVAEFVFSPLASSKAVLDKRSKEHGAMILDFGGGVSNLAVFEEGDLIYTSVIPIGSNHITNDLAIALRTTLDVAEQIKLEHGSIGGVFKKDQIDLSELMGEEATAVSKKQIGEVVQARTAELMEMTTKELKKINKFSLLPGGAVLAGGGSKLPGFLNLAKEELKLPVRFGSIKEIDGVVNRVEDPSFTTAIGLAMWGMDREFTENERQSRMPSSVSGIFGKIKKIFKVFIP